jgi:hypothetical protein
VYEKLIVDRLIDFARPLWPGIPPAAQIPAQFVKQPKQFLNIQESAKFDLPVSGKTRKSSNVVVGQHAVKGHRTFGWLTWLPGSISYVNMAGHDVLTGPMSGCDLVMYRQGGKVMAAHLGTDIGAAAANTAVKTLWNNFALAHPHDVIGGFNPFNDVNPWIPARKWDDAVGPPVYYGVYTTNNRFYTLVLYAQQTSGTDNRPHPTLKRFAGIRRIHSKTLAQLQNL